MIDGKWLSHELLGLKGDWLFDIKLFSVENVNIFLCNSLSNVLPETGSKEIGQ